MTINSFVIYGGSILTMDKQDTIYKNGWIEVLKDRIIGLGEGLPPKEVFNRVGKKINAKNKVIMPGLINGHTHLSQSFMRGLGDGLRLLDWLKQIKPIQSAMTPQDMELASLLGLVENLHCGVTSVVQHHKITSSREHVTVTLKAAQKVGLRFLLIRGWRDSGDFREEQGLFVEEMNNLVENWHELDGGRITIGFGPMVPWRCSDKAMRQNLKIVRKWNLSTHIHVAETKEEVEMFKRERGLRHIEWLEKLGALGPDIQLVHCVWVNSTEIKTIARSKTIVVHCPVSNMYLASGIAPINKMIDERITVALGTDGSASNNSQDMLATIKTSILLARIGENSAYALLPEDSLRMATVNGAQLFNRKDIGLLAVNNKADITIINLDTARSTPVFSLMGALAHTVNASDVYTVIVDGNILLDAGKVTMINETELLKECRKNVARLMKNLKIKHFLADDKFH